MTADTGQRALESADAALTRTDFDAVIAHLSAAIRAFTAAGEPCAAALACVRLGQLLGNYLGNLTASRAWFGRAERLVADLPPCIEQGWVAVAAMGCDVDDPDALLARADLALERARRFGNLNLETKALADGGLAHVQAGRIDLGMAMLDEAMALACGPADDSDAAGRSVCSFFTACYFAMDFERANNWADLLRKHGLIGLSPGAPIFLSTHCDSVQATLLMELGRWGDAEALLTRSIADFEASMGPSWHPAIALADLRTRQGRYADAEVLLLGKEQAPQAMLPAARLQFERGDHALAVTTARRGLGLLGEDRLRAVELLTVIIDGLLTTGDITGARAACDDLVRRLEGIEIAALVARRDAALAAVLAAEGDPAEAASLLQHAIDRIDPAVLPWRRAVLMSELGRLLEAAGDPSGARDATDAAAASFAALDVVAPPSTSFARLTSAARPSMPPSSTAVLAAGDKWWSVTLEDTSVRLPATKGLAYLGALVAAPGVERHVLDLVDRVEGVDVGAAPDRRSLGDAGPLLDGAARLAYRRRIEALRGDIDEALAAHAYDHAEALQQELDLLIMQLAAAFGVGGRARAAGSAVERARLNVTRAIRSALKKLDDALPEAGAALDRRIRTGIYCAYAPQPGDRIRWIVQSGVNGTGHD